MKKNPALVLMIAGLVLAAAGLLIFWGLRSGFGLVLLVAGTVAFLYSGSMEQKKKQGTFPAGSADQIRAAFDPQPHCDAAVQLAAQFGKQLSYQPADVETVEEILGVLHNDYQAKKLSDPEAMRCSTVLGIYLGEVMLRNGAAEHGFFWKLDGSEPCLMNGAGNTMFPAAKTWKRIANGSGDDVRPFYETGMKIADGSYRPS